MKKAWKILMVACTALVFAILLIVNAKTAKADGEGTAEHKHCVCSGFFGASSTACPYKGTVHSDGVVWTAWDAAASSDYQTTIPQTSGYYYLTEDVKLGTTGYNTSNDAHAGQEIYLCLNGFNILKLNASTARLLQLNGASLNGVKYVFTNCGEKNGDDINLHGAIKHAYKYSSTQQAGLFWLNQSKTQHEVQVFNVFIDMTNINAYYGNIQVSNNSKNKISMYGVEIAGGKVDHNTNGGGILLISTGTVNLTNCVLTGGNSQGNALGGSIHVNGSNATLNLSATSITGGSVTSSNYGKTVYLQNGTLKISGQTTIDDLYLASGKTVTLGDTLTNTSYIGIASADGTGQVTAQGTANTRVAMNFKSLDATKYVDFEPDASDAASYLKLSNLADITDAHYTTGHCDCGAVSQSAANLPNHAQHSDVQWIPWSATKSIPNGFTGEESYYYLVTDVTLGSTVTVKPNSKVHLCLNGHQISFSNAGRMLSLAPALGAGDYQTYVLTNCKNREDAIIKSTGTANYAGQGGTLWSAGNYEIDLYHLIVDGGTRTISKNSSGKSFDGALVCMDDGTLKAYDVSFIHGKTLGNGGALASKADSDITLSGCTFSGCTAEGNGGQLFISNTSTVDLINCSVEDGTAKAGGNVFVNTDATLNISDSTIEDGSLLSLENNANNLGGNLLTQGTVTMSSGTISGGKGGRGGNVDVKAGSFTLSNGTISGGYAGSGSNVRVENGASFVMEDGSIQDPADYTTEENGQTVTLKSEFNVMLNLGASMTMTGGSITDSDASGTAHGVYVNGSRDAQTQATDNAAFTMTGGTLGVTSSAASAIRSYGNVGITDGFVSGRISSANYAAATPYPAEIALTGGYYSLKPSVDYLPDGYLAFDDTTYSGYLYYIQTGYMVETGSEVLLGEIYGVGAITGGGAYPAGSAFTLIAPEVSGYEFVGWYENGAAVSGAANLTFSDTADASRTLIATYRYGKASGCTVTILGTTDYTIEGTGNGPAYPTGSTLTVRYTGTDAFNGWFNASGKPVSREVEYTFDLTSDVTLTAMTAAAGAPIAVFYNAFHQIMKSIAAGTGMDASLIPAVPDVRGKAKEGWKTSGTLYVDNTALAAFLETLTGSVTLEVLPFYTDSTAASDTYQLTLAYREQGASGIPEAWTALAEDTMFDPVNLTEAVHVTAKETLNGLSFIGFYDGANTLLSTAKATNVRFAENTKIYAVYGVSQADVQPTVRFVTAEKDGTTVYFEALRDVPVGYTLKEQGVLFTVETALGTLTPEEALLYDSTVAYKFVSNGTAANDVTGLTLKNIPATVYARAYVVFEKDGVEGIVYSEIAFK